MEICCWWCTYPIEGEIFKLPYKMERSGKYHVMGNFCSWECMKTYNMHENKLRFGEIQSFISSMRLKRYGKIMSLGCAPNRYCLKKFGGNLGIEEFRSKCGANPPTIRMPETQNFLHEIVEKKSYTKKESVLDSQRMNMIKGSSSNAESLKLKRPVPIKREVNNLESALGIVRKPKGCVK